jgi:ABC-2 type transport system ATP-binding protein
MNNTNQLLRAECLRRSFGKHMAVENVSLSLRRGEVLGLLGLNGAGKTTTLNMLSGLISPSSGWVKITGLDINQHPIETRSRLGFLPDTPPLYPELRVSEFLSYAARLHRISKTATPNAVERVINLCQLEQVATRLIGNLSKGFRQRVGLAQAIIHQPDLLILDEPSSGLDPIQMVEMRELIKKLASECGVILSSHILPEITAICQRVNIIHHGKMIHEEQLQSTEQQTLAHHYLCLSQAVEQKQLASLKAISSATMISQYSWDITCLDKNSVHIVTQCIAENWQVLEFSPAKNSLEERFASLTIGQDSAYEKTS